MAEKDQHYSQRDSDLFHKLSDTHYRTDVKGRITYVSSGVYDLLGYRPEEALGQRLTNVYVHPRERKKIVKTLMCSDGKAKYVSAQLRHKDGSIRWISTNAFTIKDKEGNFCGIEGIARDISKDKHLEHAKEEAERQHRLLRLVMDSTPDIVFFKDYKNSDGIYIGCNRTFVQFMGLSCNEIKGRNDFELFGDEAGARHRHEDQEVLLSGESHTYEKWLSDANGHNTRRSTLKTPLKNEAGETLGVLGISRDITEQFNAEQKLKEERQYLQSIIDGIDGPVMLIGDAYTVQLMNKAAHKSIDNRLISNSRYPKCYEISHHRSTPCDGVDHPCPLQQVIETKKSVTVTHNHPDENGNDRYVELTASPLWNQKDEFIGVIETIHDITAHLETQSQLQEQKDIIEYQTHHDSLTGLANRTLFLDRLRQIIKKAHRSESKVAILFIDLDNFKEINDSLGHRFGDKVLKAVTGRLLGVMRETDTIARLGGDEFAMIIDDNLKSPIIAIDIIQKMVQIMKEPIVIEGHSLYITLSIGIALYPDDGVIPDILLKNADAAMYKAKEEGRNTYQFYTENMTEKAFERIVMETSLRQALEAEEFIVHYQPQINAKTAKLIGMEALVRWEHSSMGLISPAKFISLAEEMGLIVDLDRQVMRIAMEQLTAWYKEGLEPGILALNLAMKQLQQDDFIPILKSMLKETGCKPEWLELEVTEGKIMKNPEQAIETLRKINNFGITLAIDDFGTGYSSLAYLKRLPIDKLKIDRSFVMDIPDDEDDVAIVQAVIALSKSMNMSIIAEGVETKEQKDFLLENGCYNIQGYYYSRPVHADKMAEMLHQYKSTMQIQPITQKSC